MDKITVYMPDADGAEFRANVKAEQRKITTVLARLIREYNHRASDSSTVGAQPTERTP